MNPENRCSIPRVAFIVTLCVYMILVPAARASDNVNGNVIDKSESDTRDNQHNPLSRHDSEYGLANEMQNIGDGQGQVNLAGMKQYGDFQSSHSTFSQPEVNAGVIGTTISSNSVHKKTKHLEDRQSDFIGQIQILNKPNVRHTMRTSQLRESSSSGQLLTITTEEKLDRLSKVPRLRRELKKNGKDQPQSKSSTIPDITGSGVELRERRIQDQKQKLTIFRKTIMDSFNERTTEEFPDHPVESSPSENPGNSGNQDTDEKKLPRIQRITMNVLRSGLDGGKKKSLPLSRKLTEVKGQTKLSNVGFQIPPIYRNYTGSTSRKPEDKGQNSSSNGGLRIPFLNRNDTGPASRITKAKSQNSFSNVNLQIPFVHRKNNGSTSKKTEVIGRNKPSNVSIQSTSRKTEVKGQNSSSNIGLQTPLLNRNGTGSTSRKREQSTVGVQGKIKRKGSQRESKKDIEIDDTLVSDGARNGFVSAAEWSHDHTGIARRRGDLKQNRLVRPSAADRLEQHISPDLNRSYRELMDHLHGILQTLSQSLQRLKSYNKEIFNVTRYDIMMGTREIIEKINEANDYTYGGVISATQFAREVTLKYYNSRNAKVATKLQEAPLEMLDSNVAERNFQPQLNRASEENKNVEAKITNVKTLKMKCVQGESRLKQVRELFHTNYDRSIIRDLYDYLNTSIIQINIGLRMSPQLRELNRLKIYLDHIKNVLAAAKYLLVNSADEISKGRRQMQVNNDMYNKWLQEKHNSHQFPRMLRDRRLTLPSVHFIKLPDLIFQAKTHASKLKSQENTLQSLLGNTIDAAKAFMSRNDNNARQHQLQSLTNSLQLLMKNMFSTLDVLRVYIGSKIKITPSKMCRPQIEGSGLSDNEDDEDLCDEEGSGFDNSDGGKVFSTVDEDFTFVAEPVDIAHLPVHSIKQLGLDLTDFTSRLLRNSHQIYDSAQSLQKPLADLQQLRSNKESSVSALEKSANMQNDFILNFEDHARNFKEMKSKIHDISQKVANLISLKLDDAVEKAKQAIEKTNKHIEVDRRPHPEKILPKEMNEKTVDRTDKQEKLEDDFSYSNLLKQGEEIISNHAELKLIQSMTIEKCGKIGSSFTYIKNNMSLLHQKVERARQMLTNLQLSISKSGSGHISLPIPHDHPETASSLTTSIRVCVKPKSTSGTLLFVTGNNSASYSLSLQNGKMTVKAYNKEYDDIGTVVIDLMSFTEQWYTLEIQRTGETLFLTAVSQTGDTMTTSKMIDSLELLQPLPLLAYVGGVPPNLGISGAPWEGCVGELTVNGRALNLLISSSEGTKPSLCSDHCISDVQKHSIVFSGNGFARFIWPERERISLISLKFRTHQKLASLLSVINKNHRFYLTVVLANGALKIESSSPNENVVLLSLNNSLNDGLSHYLRIVYKGSRTYPELDGNKEAFSVERATPQILTEILDGVVIGAFVSISRQFWNTSYRPFIGCLSDIVINGDKLLLPDAADVYNTFHGSYNASSKDIWQSCWQWVDHSKPLSLGAVENSNRISLLVSRDAVGPLIHFTKEDKFDIEVTMASGSIEVSSDDSQGAMIRPVKDNSSFILVTIVDDGTNVLVKAWDQSVNLKYGGLWGFVRKDLTKLHTVVLGEARGVEDLMFVGSISQFIIEDRFHDLSQYRSSFNLSPCERPLEEIPQVAANDVEQPFSWV